MIKTSFIILTLVFFYIFPAPFTSIAVEGPLQKVLIFHSYHRGHKWTDDQHAGIESALREAIGPNQIYVEYMDTGRMGSEGAFKNLYRALSLRYAGLKFDVICVTNLEALNFMIAYRDSLFPGTPVVFSGVHYVKASDLKGAANFTGVSVETDLKANIDLALKLHPGTKRVVYINEWTSTGRRVHDALERIIPLYEGALKFRLLEDVDTKDVFDVIGSLPPESVILYGFFGKDKEGRVLDYDEIIALFSRNTKAPIYSPWNFNLEHGVVGGAMVDGYSQGEEAGRICLRILRGGKVGNIPIVTRVSRQYMFDHEQLKRFNIEHDRLPQNSIIVNYPESLYQKYRTLINGVAVAFATLLCIIAVLVINIRARSLAETQLKSSREELRALTWRLTEADETGRKMLSRELHDEIGQNLTILGVSLGILRSLIPEDTARLAHARINDSMAVIKQIAERVRNLMSELRSPVLDDYGLTAAIDLFAKQCEAHTGLSVTVKESGPFPDLPAPVENALFRITQEALTNVVKHAQATQAKISVERLDNTLRLSIMDNGTGYDGTRSIQAGQKRGWGLITMSERALAVGGTCRVDSRPGLGTHIIVEVPI